MKIEENLSASRFTRKTLIQIDSNSSRAEEIVTGFVVEIKKSTNTQHKFKAHQLSSRAYTRLEFSIKSKLFNILAFKFISSSTKPKNLNLNFLNLRLEFKLPDL